MKVPSTTALSFPTLSPLLTSGKNKVAYFLDSVVFLVELLKFEITLTKTVAYLGAIASPHPASKIWFQK
jgi:hypothetical protein